MSTDIRKASFKDRVTINDFIRDKVQKVDGTEYVLYLDNWSDAAVAANLVERKLVDPHINASMVSYVRKEMYGQLKPRAPEARVIDLSPQVAKDVEELKENLRRLWPNVNSLNGKMEAVLRRLDKLELAVKHNR